MIHISKNTNKYILVFAIAIIISAIPHLPVHQALASPLVMVSPTCGPANPGFNIVVNANGFKPDSSVIWMFVDSSNGIPLYGYFQTNSTGGFNDVTYADNLKPDHYKIAFGTDENNDAKFDAETPIVFANVDIPCQMVQQAPLNQAPLIQTPPSNNNLQSTNWLEICQKIQDFLLNPCSMYVNENGGLTQEGVRARNCIVNGGLISALGSLKFPPNVIIGMLELAAGPTGCGGIVDFTKLKAATDPSTFLKALGIG